MKYKYLVDQPDNTRSLLSRARRVRALIKTVRAKLLARIPVFVETERGTTNAVQQGNDVTHCPSPFERKLKLSFAAHAFLLHNRRSLIIRARRIFPKTGLARKGREERYMR